MPRDFSVDIWSVKEQGVEKWRAELFWPVTGQEFHDLHDEVEKLYLGIASESPPDVGDSLWVLYSWGVTEVAMLLHTLLVTRRLHQNGFTMRYHPSHAYYKTLVEGQAIQSIMGKRLPGLFSSGERTRGWLRSWRYTVEYYGFDVSYFFDRSRRPHYLAVEWRGQRDNFAGYATSQGKHLAIVHWSQLMPGSLCHTDKLPGASQSTSRYASGLQAIAHRHGVEFEPEYLENLGTLLLDSLQYITDYVRAISQKLCTREPTSILLQGLGNLALRSLCVAGQTAGHHLVGFSHGNNVGMYKYSNYTYIPLSMVDSFAVPTQDATELFSLALEKFLRPYGKNVKLVRVRNDEYKKIKDSTRAMPLPSSIKKVMLVEFPLVPWWYVGHDGAFWAYQLDLTLRIAELMRRHGIKTILKRHPDRLKESEDVYDPYFDELLTPPFEEIYDVADAYIFTTLRSTAFGFALLTNRPVIIFEHTLEDIWEVAREALRRRCRVVPSWIAGDGRLEFDADALIAAMQAPPDEPNDEFIEQYML